MACWMSETDFVMKRFDNRYIRSLEVLSQQINNIYKAKAFAT